MSIIREDTLRRVNEIIEEEFGYNKDEIEADTNLKNDYELESLDMVSFIVNLEKEFNCFFDDMETQEVETVQDIYIS